MSEEIEVSIVFLRMGKLILLVGLMLIVAGCLPSQLKTATLTANSIATFADATHDVLAFQYKSEQEECVQSATKKEEAIFCVSDVRKKYKPAWDYYKRLRRAWILLGSAIQAAKIMKDPNDPRLIPALAEVVKAQEGFKDVTEALEVAQ